MAYSQLPNRTSTDTNASADVNTLQDNIEALKGGTGATAPTTTIEDLSTDKADKSNVLELDNTDAFTPDADYEPATKKYADDLIEDTDWKRLPITDNFVVTTTLQNITSASFFAPETKTYEVDARVTFDNTDATSTGVRFISLYIYVNGVAVSRNLGFLADGKSADQGSRNWVFGKLPGQMIG